MARILWIEDEIAVLTVVEHVLFSEGYSVDAVETLREGRDLLRDGDYDLVIVDGRLPDGIGIALADEAVARKVQAIVITDYAFILSELTVNPGRYHLLLKPVRPNELIAAVEQVLAIAS